MIENSIRTYALSTSEHASELYSIIGQNLHLTVGHNTEDNYIVLRVINDPTSIELHMEENQQDALIQFDCYSKNPIKAQQIAAAIDKIFNKKGFKDESINVQLAVKQSRRPDFETETHLHQVSLDYLFHYHPTT